MVASGTEALRQAVLLQPDVVLMDIVLQGEIDGIEAAAQLQERFQIPVIYLTAHADRATLQRATETAPLGYLLKPFHERQLVTTLETALAKHAKETHVQTRERWLSAALSSMGAAVVLTDAEGRITLLNPLAERLTGWSHSEAQGAAVTTVFAMLESDTQAPMAHPVLHTLHAGTSAQLPFIALLRAKDDTLHPIAGCVTPLRDSQETLLGVVLVARSIADYQQRYEQERQAHTQQAINTLAAGIAHHFNNMLAGIMGYTELALGDVPRHHTAHDYLQEVLTTSHQVSDLVRQMLAFSHPQHVERSPVDLRPLIGQLLTCLEASLPAGLTVRQHAAPEVGLVFASAPDMYLVLQHLYANAVYAMRGTPGVLNLDLDAVEVEAAFAAMHVPLQPGPHVRLTVRDTGCGMTSAIQAHIFEPFFTTKEVGEGTGMGLAVVQGIITRYGGVITVESAPGKGTTFTIYLPQLGREWA